MTEVADTAGSAGTNLANPVSCDLPIHLAGSTSRQWQGEQ